jgi:hypothetical protein
MTGLSCEPDSASLCNFAEDLQGECCKSRRVIIPRTVFKIADVRFAQCRSDWNLAINFFAACLIPRKPFANHRLTMVWVRHRISYGPEIMLSFHIPIFD